MSFNIKVMIISVMLDIISLFTIIAFYCSIIYRLAYPNSSNDYGVSIFELYMLIPTVTAILWILWRTIKRFKPNSRILAFLLAIKPWQRLLVALIGACILGVTSELLANILRGH